MSVDHVMKLANNENLMWVQTEHAGGDKKLLIKFH